MKVPLLLFGCAVLLLACAPTEDLCPVMDCAKACMNNMCLPEDATVCEKPRPNGCFMKLDRVCGSDGETYGNRCIACSKRNVDWHTPGECTTDEFRCEEPRPEACTKHFDPVCAQVDTGIRCITAPCPSSERKTYGNPCTACADEDVISYRPGRC